MARLRRVTSYGEGHYDRLMRREQKGLSGSELLAAAAALCRVLAAGQNRLEREEVDALIAAGAVLKHQSWFGEAARQADRTIRRV